MPIPPECAALAQEMEDLKLARFDLRSALRESPGNKKIIDQLDRLTQEIDALQLRLDLCISTHTGSPVPIGVEELALPLTCGALTEELGDLRATRIDLRSLLREFPGSEKITVRIAQLTQQIDALQLELDQCLRTSEVIPVEVTFVGTATLTTTFVPAPGPFVQALSMGLLFTADRTQVFITSFTPITTAAFPTPFGSNFTTITKSPEGGSGAYSNGDVVIPITLHFDQSLDLPALVEDSDLKLSLSTQAKGGSKLSSGGHIDLAGSGVFDNGILQGSTGTLVVNGMLMRAP
jgi:hypothetical protein